MKKENLPNQKLSWTLGTLLVMLPILALYFTNMSTYIALDDPIRNKFAIQNIGRGFLVAFVCGTLLLTAYQQMAYWPFLNKKDRAKLDERQLRVRHRVFERSYVMMPIALILTLWLTNDGVHYMQNVIWWVFVTGFFAMPAIVGARQNKF